MGYFSEEEMLSLIKASNTYKDALELPTINESLDPNKLKFEEFSSILEGRGFASDGLNADEHVIKYIFSDPSRYGFLDILDEEIPEEFIPRSESDYIPGWWKTIGKQGERMVTNLWAITPAMVTESISNLSEQFLGGGAVGYLDWRELGRYISEDSWEAADIITKFGSLWKDAEKLKKDDDKAEVLKMPGSSMKISTKGSLLNRAEDYFATHAENTFNRYMKNPKNRAHWNYIQGLGERAFTGGKSDNHLGV